MNMPAIDLKTEKGLRYTFYGLTFLIITQIISSLAMVVIWEDLLPILNDPKIADESMLYDALTEVIIANFALYAGLFCTAGLVMFSTLILILLGLVNLYTGRTEFGDEHTKNVQKSIIFIVIGFVIGAFSSIVPSAANVSGLITSIFYGLGFYLLLKNLLDKSGTKIIFAGMILLIVISLAQLISNLLVDQLISDRIDKITYLYHLISVFGALMAIAWVLIALGCYHALKRLSWGMIKPNLPTHALGISGRTCPGCGAVVGSGVRKCDNCDYYFEDLDN